MKKVRRKTSFFGKMLRIFLIIILSPFLFVRAVVLSIKNRKRNKNNAEKVAFMNISQIDTLSGEEFEMVLYELFIAMGYDVSLTKATGDFGADLVVKRKNEISVIQAKCYSKTVGAHAVQEVLGAKKHYSANTAFVVTNNFFSKEAVALALENDIKLIDRTSLSNLLSKVKIQIGRKKSMLVAMTNSAKNEIESRYKSWI